jgi:hypothetical protein
VTATRKIFGKFMAPMEQSGRDLYVECRDYWKKNPDVPIGTEGGLLREIQRFQNGELSPQEEESLVRRVLCQNWRVRGIWNRSLQLLRREFNCRCQAEEGGVQVDRLSRECVGWALWDEVSSRISRFDPSKLEDKDNQGTLRLVSKFIASYIYVGSTLRKAGFFICETFWGGRMAPIDEEGDADGSISDPEIRTIQNEQWAALETALTAGFREARQQRQIDVYVHEVLTDSGPRSQRARQQKRRLSVFLKGYLEQNLEGCVNHIGDEGMSLLMERLEIWIRENESEFRENSSRARSGKTI